SWSGRVYKAVSEFCQSKRIFGIETVSQARSEMAARSIGRCSRHSGSNSAFLEFSWPGRIPTEARLGGEISPKPTWGQLDSSNNPNFQDSSRNRKRTDPRLFQATVRFGRIPS